MGEIDIRRCTVAELDAAPNLYEVLEEYARESPVDEIGPACPQIDAYRKLEAVGALHPIAAFDHDGCLIGFILPLVGALPHFGVVTATAESFFVPQTDRRKGTGMRLLLAAEALSLELGAKALFITARTGTALAQVMRGRKSYRHSNEVFVRALT